MSKGYRFDEDNANNFGLMIRSGDLDTIKSADDLTDKIVVCQSGSLQELFATEQIPACRELKRVSATTDGFLMVQEGKADAVVTEKRQQSFLSQPTRKAVWSLFPIFPSSLTRALPERGSESPKAKQLF